MEAAPAVIPPKPKIAAMMATIKNPNAQRNIVFMVLVNDISLNSENKVPKLKSLYSSFFNQFAVNRCVTQTAKRVVFSPSYL